MYYTHIRMYVSEMAPVIITFGKPSIIPMLSLPCVYNIMIMQCYCLIAALLHAEQQYHSIVNSMCAMNEGRGTPDFFYAGLIQLSFHTSLFTQCMQGVFSPNVTTLQSNYAKSLHFSAFNCMRWKESTLTGNCISYNYVTDWLKPNSFKGVHGSKMNQPTYTSQSN